MTKDIYQALNDVMHEVGYVQKKRAGHLNYSYAGESALIAAVRPELVKQGVVVHPGQVLELRQDTYTTSKGSVMNRTVVVMSYRFAHDESGTFIDVPVVGEGADVGDKSANKALTGAYKYALRQTLLIETGDDPDNFKSVPHSTQAADGPTWPADGEKPTPNDNSQEPETPEPVKAKAEPIFNLVQLGKIADAIAWLEGEASAAGHVVFGFVADAAVKSGLYKSREHVRNALKGNDEKPGYDFPANFDLHFGKNVTITGGLKVFDWLMDRKKVEVE